MSKNKITLDKTKDKSVEIVCNNCDKETNHIVCNSLESWWGDDEIQGINTYEIIRCLGCDNISFRSTSNNSEDYDHDDEGNCIYSEVEQIYPNRLMGRTALKDIYSLPENVRSVYIETHTALCTKLNILSGIGIRTLIESVCLEESAKGRNLEKKIDSLIEKGVLTKRNASVLHKTRILGNFSAHQTKPATDSELEVAFDIVENLLETVYIIPKKSERLKRFFPSQ